MSRKRVLFVCPSLVGGGAERVAALLLQHLDRQKFEPLLVVFQDRFDYPVPEDVTVICFYKRGAYDLPRLIWRLAQAYEKEKPDTVISFLNYANLIAVMAKRLSRARPRLLLTEHGDDDIGISLKHTFLSFPKRWAFPLIYPKADTIICVSRGVADNLVTRFKIPRQKIKVVYSPVDIDYVSRLAEEEVDHPYFAPKETPVIIAIGWLIARKGHPYLLKAFAQVTAEFPCRLIIRGDGKEKKALVKLVRQLGIERQVDFLGFQQNPFKYVARSDIFVLSSLWEGFGLVIIEAMTCGTPVISTRCPFGPGEIITDGVNGLLVPAADEMALAEAMLRLLNDKDLSAKLAQAGKKRAEDFAMAKITEEYERLF